MSKVATNSHISRSAILVFRLECSSQKNVFDKRRVKGRPKEITSWKRSEKHQIRCSRLVN